MKTRMTEMLGIQYPIMQGGMQNLGVPALAAAVSEAGGLGTINATIYPEIDDLRTAIRETKTLTDKPFCVNISLLPGVSVGDATKEVIRVCGEEGVKVIETAGTSPKDLVPLIHDAGMLHFHKVPGIKYALSAERAGVDAVEVVGFECGGHPGAAGLGSVVLTDKAAKKCKIPVIAGGGYGDGYGMAAALAMGAEGVVMGTRFVATVDCPIHDNFKQWMVQADEADTVLCQKAIRNMVRVADNATAKECLELEKEPGITVEKLMPVIQGKRGRTCYQNGDIDGCLFPIGTTVGLIEDIPTVKEAVGKIVREFKEAVERLNRIG
ncbi:nitronate monooxygenase [Clostridium sp. AN503]|uniref:NAD(P)H-dependent flavin oxidoreductase n=1 Tax=Clostridium sp. AN503 TaxID=3160598 RepID=UPI0034591488